MLDGRERAKFVESQRAWIQRFRNAQRLLPRTKVWNTKQTQRVCEGEDEGPQAKDARSSEVYF